MLALSHIVFKNLKLVDHHQIDHDAGYSLPSWAFYVHLKRMYILQLLRIVLFYKCLLG